MKRCVEMSPSYCQPQKRRASGASSSAKQLFSDDSQGPAIILPNPNQSHDVPVNIDGESHLSDQQQQMIARALIAKDVYVLAVILKEHCANVVDALQKLLVKDASVACAKLCKRSGGSALYGNDYDSLNDFRFDKIWEELTGNLPFLIDLMNAVAGEEKSIEDTRQDLRVRYNFLYSILMSERWHELNLVKRVNTVLVIEGGCSKQVNIRWFCNSVFVHKYSKSEVNFSLEKCPHLVLLYVYT